MNLENRRNLHRRLKSLDQDADEILVVDQLPDIDVKTVEALEQWIQVILHLWMD